MTDLLKIVDAKSFCHKLVEKSFDKGETITSYIEKRKQIFILISGEAILVRYDEKGNKDIVDFFYEGSVFGEAFYDVHLSSELSVIATKKCKVLTIMLDDVVKKCESKCKSHEELNDMLLNLLFENTIHLNSRIEVMSKRTIREKLLLYFNNLSKEKFSSVITLPFSLTDLADFLSVNRSAMMRELKTLEDDRIIVKIRTNTYRLLVH